VTPRGYDVVHTTKWQQPLGADGARIGPAPEKSAPIANRTNGAGYCQQTVVTASPAVSNRGKRRPRPRRGRSAERKRGKRGESVERRRLQTVHGWPRPVSHRPPGRTSEPQ
jgi:hypothetical protein